jgi:hypothetical protein
MENLAGRLICTHSSCIDKLESPWQPGSKLPLILTDAMISSDQHSGLASFHAFRIADEDIVNPSVPPKPSVLLPKNLNLTGSQKELLLWHQRLGHANLKRVQSLLGQPRTEK